MTKKNNYKVPALEKGLIILEKLTSTEECLRITDLHEQLSIPKTSVFMIMSTLETMGFVEKIDENRYRLTMKLYNMGNDILSKYDIRGIAYPFMEQIANEFRLTAHLAILSGGRAVYIEKVNGPAFVQFGTKIGQAMSIHTSAVGKVFAAYLKDEELDEIFERFPLVRATENTITSPELFKQFLPNIKEMGYAIEDEEGEVGVRCIGSPIFDKKGKVIAAMSVTGVRNDIPSVLFQEIGTKLKEKCEAISKQFSVISV